MQIPADRLPVKYPPDAERRFFEMWKTLATIQNYSTGTDNYVTEPYANLIKRFFSSPSKLLFLGCGDGGEVEAAVALGHDAWGITLNPNNIKYAREVLDLENIYMMDAHVMPVEWASQFDGVFGLQFLEHSPAPIFMLMEVYRVLKSGGLAFFLTPGPGVSGTDNYTLGENAHHIICYTAPQAEGLLLKSGFKDVHVDVVGAIDSAVHLNFFGRKP